MIIVGAGLSGLIAASMLREECSAIFEAQQSLPNNHHALLRFKTPVVGDAVGIPFRKVRVMKAIQPWRNPVADALSYSMKATGKAELRSIVSAAGEVEARYIAPPDLIARLGAQVGSKIAYGQAFANARLSANGEPIISTIPMPALMEALGWEERPEFGHRSGEVITVDLPSDLVDVCATVYLPSPTIEAYRVSITDRRLIIEFSHTCANVDLVIFDCLEALGLTSKRMLSFCRKEFQRKQMTYAKIKPIDEGLRRRFVMWASEAHNVYSLGRFATWRPGLLLDDIVNDVRVIQRLVSNRAETYAHKMKG